MAISGVVLGSRSAQTEGVTSATFSADRDFLFAIDGAFDGMTVTLELQNPISEAWGAVDSFTEAERVQVLVGNSLGVFRVVTGDDASNTGSVNWAAW